METPPPVETQPNSGKPGRLLFMIGIPMIVAIVAAIGVYTWLYLYGPCGVNQVDVASSALMEKVNAFSGAYQSAPAMTPIALIGPITQMQQTLMDTKEVPVPRCMQVARNELITSMESAIRAILAIMESKPESTVTDLMDDSTAHFENFTTEMESVNKCAPLCR